MISIRQLIVTVYMFSIQRCSIHFRINGCILKPTASNSLQAHRARVKSHIVTVTGVTVTGGPLCGQFSALPALDSDVAVDLGWSDQQIDGRLQVLNNNHAYQLFSTLARWGDIRYGMISFDAAHLDINSKVSLRIDVSWKLPGVRRVHVYLDVARSVDENNGLCLKKYVSKKKKKIDEKKFLKETFHPTFIHYNYRSELMGMFASTSCFFSKIEYYNTSIILQ